MPRLQKHTILAYLQPCRRRSENAIVGPSVMGNMLGDSVTPLRMQGPLGRVPRGAASGSIADLPVPIRDGVLTGAIGGRPDGDGPAIGTFEAHPQSLFDLDQLGPVLVNTSPHF